MRAMTNNTSTTTSAAKKAAAKKAATKKATTKRPATTNPAATIEQVLDRLSAASKGFVDEVEEQVRHLEDRVADLRDRGEHTAEHWVEVIETRARAIRTDLERMASRVASVGGPPAKKPAAKKPAAKKAAANKSAARKQTAKKAAAKKA